MKGEEGSPGIRFGYWMPVFGGWLRNVEDEGMEASWAYVSQLARRSEEIGFDLSLLAELNLNDIKGPDAPSLDAWSTAAALAAVTQRLELMVAVRPTFHSPALLAKQAANIDHISGGRVSLNVVSAWWASEARQYGVDFDAHDDRYAQRILEFRRVGVDLLLLQFSPQAEEMERFAEEVIPLVREREAGTGGRAWGVPERAAG